MDRRFPPIPCRHASQQHFSEPAEWICKRCAVREERPTLVGHSADCCHKRIKDDGIKLRQDRRTLQFCIQDWRVPGRGLPCDAIRDFWYFRISEVETPITASGANIIVADPLFDPWCANEELVAKNKTLRLLNGRDTAQPKAVETIQKLIPKHYCDPSLVETWLKRWGYKKSLDVLKDDLPESKKARSGDIGEILATEYINRKLEFTVPIFRLRWRDHRELALRGDDLFAIRIDEDGRVHFLKGEAKSRQKISTDVVTEAGNALRSHEGRPGPHTINFVVKRLADLGEDELYEALEDYLTRRTIPRKRLTHLIFVLAGNDPKPYLDAYLDSYSGGVPQIVVGLRVKDHGVFVKTVFDGVSLA